MAKRAFLISQLRRIAPTSELPLPALCVDEGWRIERSVPRPSGLSLQGAAVKRGSDVLRASDLGKAKGPFPVRSALCRSCRRASWGSVVARFEGQELALQSVAQHAVTMVCLRDRAAGLERPFGSTGRGWGHAGATVPGCADIMADAPAAFRPGPERARRWHRRARRPDGCGRTAFDKGAAGR